MDETTTLEQATDETAADTVEDANAIDAIDTIDEELLIEEVSIDGMCGVY